jgi:hypothetical protein
VSGFILFYASPGMRLELIIELLAAMLVGSIAFGLLSMVGATVYGKVLTRESTLRYGRRIEANDRFLLLAHGTREAAVARDAIAAMEQSTDPSLGFEAVPGDTDEPSPASKEAANLDAVTGSRGGKLRLVFQRRFARLRGQ